MAPPTPRTKRNSPKQEQLLDHAEKLFYEHGFHAVGIDTILAESGLAKMTLYYHFKSKDELIVAVLKRRALRMEGQWDAAVKKAGEDPFDQLSAIFAAHGRWFRERSFNGCAFIRAVGEFPDPSSPIHETATQHKSRLIERFERIAQALEHPQPEQLAQRLYLLSEGAIVRAHLFNDSQAAQSAEEAAQALIDAELNPPQRGLPVHLL